MPQNESHEERPRDDERANVRLRREDGIVTDFSGLGLIRHIRITINGCLEMAKEGIIMTELAHIIPGPSVSLRTSVAHNCRKRSAESRRQNTSRNLLRLWRSISNRCAGGRDQQTAFSEFVNHARLGFLISLFEREFTARHGTPRRGAGLR
jgi:hypothetical protein